jgi:hypothetical protein
LARGATYLRYLLFCPDYFGIRKIKIKEQPYVRLFCLEKLHNYLKINILAKKAKNNEGVAIKAELGYLIKKAK